MLFLYAEFENSMWMTVKLYTCSSPCFQINNLSCFSIGAAELYNATNEKVDLEVDGSCGGQFGTYYISCFSFTWFRKLQKPVVSSHFFWHRPVRKTTQILLSLLPHLYCDTMATSPDYLFR